MQSARGTIFTAQEPRPSADGVGQDKGAFECERTKQPRPALVTHDMRAHQTTEHHTDSTQIPHRTKKQRSTKRYRKQRTIWLEPDVDAELQRIAEQTGLSFSMTGANLVKYAVRQTIAEQHAALLIPMLEQALRNIMRRKTELDVQCHKDISQLLRLVYNILVRMPDSPQMSEQSINQIRDESANAAYKDMQQRLAHTRILFGDEHQNVQGEEGSTSLWQS